MPELPEVETIKRQLSDVLIGQIITDIDILNPKSFHGEITSIIGMQISGIRRFGKVLVIDLKSQMSFVVHLKMTGQLVFECHESGDESQENWQSHLHKRRLAGGHPTGDFVGELPSKHTRIMIKLKGNSGKRKTIVESEKTADEDVSDQSSDVAILYFNDQRKFGWMKLVPTEEVEKLSFIEKLGQEPVDFDEDEWVKVLKSSRKAVKVRLMDQDRIAGVGNIYANDGCWEACVDPRRPANSLSESESFQLLKAVRKVLEEGIYYGGATAGDGKYINLQGMGGKYQEHFRVYQREGDSCLRSGCKGVIQKTMVGGRGTFWCGECQV